MTAALGRANQTGNSLRLLAICGIVGPIFFTTIVIILGAIRPGYSHVSQTISELGAAGAPNAIGQVINFVVTGLLLLAFALGIHRGMSGGKGSRIAPSLAAYSGVSWILGGTFFPWSGTFFPWIPPTVTGGVHDVLGLTSFAALSGAALILSRRLKKDSQWQNYRSFSLVMGLLMIVFLLAFMISFGGLPYYTGAIQRLMVGTFFVWIEVLAIRLFQVASKARSIDVKAE